MYIRVLLLLAAATIVIAEPLRYHLEKAKSQFKEFVQKYDKQYENEIEEAMRLGIFLKNLEFIDFLNQRGEGVEFGITQFADRLHEEDLMLDESLKPDYSTCETVTDVEVGNFNLTETEFDWRTRGVVSQVKHQINCGACWAFSTIGNVEGVYARKTGQLVELSAQQLVDCDTSSVGCNGGYTTTAISYLATAGSMSDASYPYIDRDGACQYDASKVAVKILGCQSMNVQESAFAQKLMQIGPLSILIDGTTVKPYKGGILQGYYCKGYRVNHAVLLVGFGEENGVKYWIIKNSWGQHWGEQGYFRMVRDVNCVLVGDNPPVTAVV